MDNKIIKNNKKTIGMIIGGIAFVVLAVGITYAWLTWVSNETTLEGTTGSFSVAYSKGGNIFNEALLPVESYLQGESSWVAFKNDNNIDGYATINLNITDLVTRGTCYEAEILNSMTNQNILCQDTWDNTTNRCLMLSDNTVSNVTNTYCNATLTWNDESGICSNSLFTTQETCETGITYFESNINLSHLHYAIYPGTITYDGDNISNVVKDGDVGLIAGTLELLNNNTMPLCSNIPLTNEYQALIIYIWLDSEAGNEFVGTTITGNISASATTNSSVRDVDMAEEMAEEMQ